ncbi:bacterial transcriptional activator domain-containing protein [Spirillospora sp. NPDC047279]|uniref:AfsR/SARP family transcriptional regulator n=1 Tax=Spirillospora sp. NPDC047279 TaxID=3155478 RepID=UPI00340BD88F
MLPTSPEATVNPHHTTPRGQAVIGLLPEFDLSLGGNPIGLSRLPGRIIILLALNGEMSRKALTAGLWPNSDPAHSSKKLSQALWRIRVKTGTAVLRVDGGQLCLADDVSVDYWAARSLAHNIMNGVSPATDTDPLVVKLLGTELLRGSHDDEAVRERERWDRLRGLALEKMAIALLETGQAAGAAEVASVATRIDQLAERPHRILATAHLEQGDTVSARRVYVRYAGLLRRELQAEPSAAFRTLVS